MAGSLRPLEGQRTFGEFLCFFHICKKTGSQEVSEPQIEHHFNEVIRFSVKRRCIVQTTCSNKHPHLLQEIVMSKNPVS